MIRLADIDVSYGTTRALQEISLQVHKGITTVVGPNGAGKTTLLRLLATALDATRGNISILGLNPRQPLERAEIRRQLGFLPQDTDTNASRLTVGELIDYLAVVKGHGDHHQRLHAIAEVVANHGLAPHLESRIGDLSAGIRRRLLLAQAFLGNPRVLVLDEPFTDLDPEQRKAAERQITAMRVQATTVVATHDINEFVAGSDTVIVLHEGRLRFHGTPVELSRLANPVAGSQPQTDTQALQTGYAAATHTAPINKYERAEDS